MYIVRQGKVELLLNEDQLEKIENKELSFEDIKLEDTIKQYTDEQGEKIQYLPFRLAYKDIDKNGKEKYIFDEVEQKFKQNYHKSPLIYALGKEKNTLLKIGAGEEAKLVYQEQWKNGRLYRTAVCVQMQDLNRISDKQNQAEEQAKKSKKMKK